MACAEFITNEPSSQRQTPIDGSTIGSSRTLTSTISLRGKQYSDAVLAWIAPTWCDARKADCVEVADTWQTKKKIIRAKRLSFITTG